MLKRVGLLVVMWFAGMVGVFAQADTEDSLISSSPKYLLLDKGLQFRITTAINSMYNFDFATAERDFAVLAHQYPNHPLPEFLVALGYWWRIEVDVSNEKYDEIFVKYLDRAIEKAEAMFDADESNKEAAFFLAASYGFQSRLYSERKSWTKAAWAGRNALKYMDLSRGEEEFNPELLLGDALFNYFSVWIPDNYPLLKPVMALFPKGSKELGLQQLEQVANNAFYTRVEAQYFLFRLYASEEKEPFKALQISEYLHHKFPNNPYFHRSYARHLYTVGRWIEAVEESEQILERIDSNTFGYESNSGRYAAFYLAQFNERMGNREEAKRFYLRTLSFGEESESQESGYYLYSLVQLGKMASEDGQKDLAKDYFKKVKKYAKRKHPAHKEAREFIKKNKL
ncbi:tol-pal system protein YbgF [Algoriphagus halophytocola]|uniref:Tol-pal system protein YbgF n=1 Tax=Algoriphagus halophytocola TaxID=2991499 RepID=A0ABY6MKL4_9BACT|nr:MULTISPECIES: tol-pal system protein YbgF [unclassified Algoriphagus]UZD23713.1 tol-pal system protein YbgF [Algoriphagus sp. TR-M5]WBL45007.1 tol-pal system protein YbgF [Algoriphagus sp. TR-M9]